MTKEEFKQLRISLGLSQPKLAKIVGVNDRSIRRFESGEWPVSKVVLDKLDEYINSKE
tara:strand:+ start:778 stop:951 length:174 start_codon:yes stop_codon:yes gene_type:complete